MNYLHLKNNTFSDWVNFQLIYGNTANLGNEAKIVLESIANEGVGLGSDRAKNLLRFHYGYEFNVLPMLPNAQAQNRISKPNLSKEYEGFVVAYPNPAKERITLEYHLPTSVAALSVIDATGKTVYMTNITTSDGVMNIDTEKWAAGLYLYKWVSKGKIVYSDKFIIQK